MMHPTFSKDNFHHICQLLSSRDESLKAIIDQYGLPPMWTRPAIFQTLVLTILEQQVSLASAYAAYQKLKSKIGFVTPVKILALTDAELRECYFSRQKTSYVKALASAIVSKQINLEQLAQATEDDIRTVLKQVKGIGDWTVDVYLMHALQRTDLFPLGDVALVNSLKEAKGAVRRHYKRRNAAHCRQLAALPHRGNDDIVACVPSKAGHQGTGLNY